jgi:hypothetical protein
MVFFYSKGELIGDVKKWKLLFDLNHPPIGWHRKNPLDTWYLGDFNQMNRRLVSNKSDHLLRVCQITPSCKNPSTS